MFFKEIESRQHYHTHDKKKKLTIMQFNFENQSGQLIIVMAKEFIGNLNLYKHYHYSGKTSYGTTC